LGSTVENCRYLNLNTYYLLFIRQRPSFIPLFLTAFHTSPVILMKAALVGVLNQSPLRKEILERGIVIGIALCGTTAQN